MNVFVLKESSEYQDCYFVKVFETRDEAIEYFKSQDFCAHYRFIEGDELRLCLRLKETEDEL